MPFSQATKAEMFVRCARICCLCFKQCGTNIEAAHIVAEADGGPNDSSNGIPLCFDCHQEIGSYDNRHPKGNRFTPGELTARRDAMYHLVESGAIQAHVVASQQQATNPIDRTPTSLPTLAATSNFEPSLPTRSLIKATLGGDPSRLSSLPDKAALLTERERAFVLDELIAHIDQGACLEAAIKIALVAEGPETRLVVIERIVKHIVFAADSELLSRLLSAIPESELANASPGLRTALFREVIDIMEGNQYKEVNKVTPAVVSHINSAPAMMRGPLIDAIFRQSRSAAYIAGPAALKAIDSLAPDDAIALLSRADPRHAYWHSESYKRIATRSDLADRLPPVIADIIRLTPDAFAEKYKIFD